LLIEAEPAAEHVGATTLVVGVAGTVSCAAILNEALAEDVHVPLLVVTV
jgi:hypothetical protein